MDNLKLILDSYKITTSPREIFEILVKGHARGDTFMWQSFSNHRTIFKIESFELDDARKKIKICYLSEGHEVDNEAFAYIKLPFRESVFKGRILQAKKNVLSIDVPTEMHIREFRESLRLEFAPGEKSAFIRPSIAGVKESQLSTLKVILKDVSQKGLGLYVSESNMHLFRTEQFLELVGIETSDLQIPILGKVVWSRRLQTHDLKSFGYGVGVKMFSLIPEALIGKIGDEPQRAPSQELLEMELLSPEFHRELQGQVRSTMMKMKQRPALAKYLRELDVIRGEDEYILEHINVLSLVCTFMARSMNWVSDASMEKFVYASYLHDAPLFQFPRLIRIKNMKEFEQIKDQLSADERVAFLSSPEAAAALANQDPAAPPDVAQMLFLQKELPSGDGIYRKSFSKIPPLAALFIVAHDLTDEVMTNTKWDMAAWHKRCRKIYIGGHFTKIMDALEKTKINFKKR